MDALKGLRVIELGVGPVTGIAGMILADFGAEIIRITPPGGDRMAKLPASPMWDRGKHDLARDLSIAADRAEVNKLCAAADVLLTNLRASTLDDWDMGADQLQHLYPHLVYCHITGFGRRGPLADIPGYEHVVAAYAGRMLQFQGITDRQGPVFTAVQVGIHAAAQSAVAGLLAAVLARGEDGKGKLVETSLLQGMLPYEMGNLIGLQFPDEYKAMLPLMSISPQPPRPSLFYHPAQAGDGRWLQFGNLLPHLFDNFLIAAGLTDVLADPAFDSKQLLLKPEENHEAFRQRMLECLQGKTASEWMEQFIADGGVVATSYQTTQQALKDPDVVANGHVVPLRSDDKGAVQLGPLGRLTETPAAPGNGAVPAAPVVSSWLSSPKPVTTIHGNDELPLSGIRVVEIATIIAAPLAAAFLADMGADVIKVEQVGGDPFRGMLGGLGAARVNAGKRSISVNLKSEEGRKLVLGLLEDADVLIHNYRPGVPERLGIGYEQVRNLNPRIIYMQCNGYGPDGPGAHRPSTHPIPGAAMGGVMYQMRESLPPEKLEFESLRKWCARLMRANELNPDPNTSLVITTATMLGLSARQRTGQGQRIIVDMFGANAYANADDFLRYPGKPPRLMPDALMHGFGPTYRLYQCSDDSWVFLALTSGKEREAFCRVLKKTGITAPDEACLEGEEAGAEAALSDLFVKDSADSWQELFTNAGVACVRADRAPPGRFWLADDQSRLNGFAVQVTHDRLGSYRRHGSMVHFNGQKNVSGGPPEAGQHNLEVLESLGYTESQVEELLDKSVLFNTRKQ